MPGSPDCEIFRQEYWSGLPHLSKESSLETELSSPMCLLHCRLILLLGLRGSPAMMASVLRHLVVPGATQLSIWYIFKKFFKFIFDYALLLGFL